jgi:hypothetical protein
MNTFTAGVSGVGSVGLVACFAKRVRFILLLHFLEAAETMLSQPPI